MDETDVEVHVREFLRRYGIPDVDPDPIKAEIERRGLCVELSNYTDQWRGMTIRASLRGLDGVEIADGFDDDPRLAVVDALTALIERSRQPNG
jgi:hypothetical protein